MTLPGKAPWPARIASFLSRKPRSVFLLDGLGALLSAGFLSLLAQWESLFGMPPAVLYPLALIACGFALYSLSCYLLDRQRWVPWLKAIAWANALYCCLTLGWVIRYFDSLTIWGLLYFILEMAVVSVLVLWEIGVVRRGSRSNQG